MIFFLFYSLLIINFVGFKFFGNITEMYNRVDSFKYNKNIGFDNINLTPLKTIKPSIIDIINFHLSLDSRNLILNLIIFIPFGLSLSHILKGKLLYIIPIFLLFIFSIEFIQYSTLLGIADIDDFIVNVSGCFLGYIFFVFLKRIHTKNNFTIT